MSFSLASPPRIRMYRALVPVGREASITQRASTSPRKTRTSTCLSGFQRGDDPAFDRVGALDRPVVAFEFDDRHGQDVAPRIGQRVARRASEHGVAGRTGLIASRERRLRRPGDEPGHGQGQAGADQPAGICAGGGRGSGRRGVAILSMSAS